MSAEQQLKQETKEDATSRAPYEDDDGYFNDFEHHVGSERLPSEDWAERLKSFENDQSGGGNIRKSTEEFLKMKRDEFWDVHKESIEETRMINEAAEYHEQLTFMRQLHVEQQQQQQQKQREIQQQQQLLAQQQAFKRAQQQQQQTQNQNQNPNQPTLPQLQTLLSQITNAITQLQVQYSQQTQVIQQSFQPHVINITAQLNKAIQLNDKNKMQQLQLQQQNMQQQFEQQIRMLQQQYAIQAQQLQANQLNVKNTIQQIQSVQVQALRLKLQTQQQHITEYIPSSISDIQNDKQIYTIRENEHVSYMQQTRPHIVDENISAGLMEEKTIITHDANNNHNHNLNGSDEVTFNRENISRNNSNISNKSSVKARMTSQSISSQISNQSQSKSPVTNIMSPSISPMKLPSHNSHSSISSPPVSVNVAVHNQNNNNRVTHPQQLSFSNNSNNTLQLPYGLPIPAPAPYATQSLPNSPLIMNMNVSLADMSRSVTPELKAQRRKTTNRNRYNNRSLPNSPFNRSQNKLKSKSKGNGATGTGSLTPLILGHNNNNNTRQTFPDTFTDINIKDKEREREISIASEEQSTVLTNTGGTTTTLNNHNNNNNKESDDSSSSEDSEDDDDKSEYTQTQSEYTKSRKDSNNSLYSYSSMSTVFTGVNDGLLLANNSVYLSKMISTEQYNKMEVVNDIKSLWLQVFSTPVLFNVICTICICWLSAYDNDNNSNPQDKYNKLGALLLCIAIFNMCGHLMIKGMTSTLSSLCDELYNANCKPLIGIQLQKIIGFSICITIPIVIGLMQLFNYAISKIYENDNDDNKDLISYMNSGINYLIFAIPALTMFYVFQRYLQGSHVLHVNGYVACCLIGSIVIELGILIIYESVPSLKQNNELYHVILISLIVAYWILLILFTICINIYKLHRETFIFAISIKQIFSFKKWGKYLNNGIYRSLLLFCNYWYFDFMIIMAGLKGINELIAFGVLCNIYHIICSIISASEFVAKSLIFRGLLHSNIAYARDSWKYTIFFGFFLSVIIGGLFFLLRENICKHIFSILSPDIQSLINNSWLYVYILIILNGIKYGLLGGAQAMGYIKLVSSINLLSFYIVTIPVYVWISNIYNTDSYGLHAIYCSILLGVCLNILCLLIFRVFINWNKELQLFAFRVRNQAQTLQESVDAVHIQLQKYKNNGHHHNNNYYHRYHKSHRNKHNHNHNHQTHSHHNKHCSHKHHSHKHHSHKNKKKHHTIKNKKQKQLLNIPLQSTMTTMSANSGSINSTNNNFGRINVMPLGRQKTNESVVVPIMSSTTDSNHICLHCSLGSHNCKCNNNKGFNYGEIANVNPNQIIYDEYHLKTRPSAAVGNHQNQNIKQFKSQMRRRTFWEDLFDFIKQYCCCCLFDGCCCDYFDECCYYCCGCCLSDSYLRDDYQNNVHHNNYHIDLNNNSKYKIIHEDSQPFQNQSVQSQSKSQNNAIKLELHNDHHNDIHNKDLKYAFISHNSIGGAHAGYLKHSLASQYDKKYTMKNSQ